MSRARCGQFHSPADRTGGAFGRDRKDVARSEAEMKTILIVDDRADNRAVLIAMLAHRGYRLLDAESGEQALQITRKEKPDLVIADVLMPKMDGYEFVRRLREDPEIAKTPVIFYTASYIEEE